MKTRLDQIGFGWPVGARLAQALLAAVAVMGATQTLADEPAEIVAGKRIFSVHCASCHGLNGTGGAGPNLTDEASIFGNGYYDIFDVVLNGVKDKPMESWRDRLTVAEIEQVTAYIVSLHGSRPGAKPATNPLRYRM